MAIGDKAGLKAVEELNAKTIPSLVNAINALVDKIDNKLDEDIKNLTTELNNLLDRINGITLSIPKRKV